MILLLTELVLLTSVLSVSLDFKTQHYTECSQQDILYTRACKAGHVLEGTHTLLVTSRVYSMSQPNVLTQARLYTSM